MWHHIWFKKKKKTDNIGTTKKWETYFDHRFVLQIGPQHRTPLCWWIHIEIQTKFKFSILIASGVKNRCKDLNVIMVMEWYFILIYDHNIPIGWPMFKAGMSTMLLSDLYLQMELHDGIWYRHIDFVGNKGHKTWSCLTQGMQ